MSRPLLLFYPITTPVIIKEFSPRTLDWFLLHLAQPRTALRFGFLRSRLQLITVQSRKKTTACTPVKFTFPRQATNLLCVGIHHTACTAALHCHRMAPSQTNYVHIHVERLVLHPKRTRNIITCTLKEVSQDVNVKTLKPSATLQQPMVG